jgi:hypothetical protein
LNGFAFGLLVTIFRPSANAADPAAGCKLQAARLQGCGCKLRAASCKAARLQVARLQAARLQVASCNVAGCKSAGDRLHIARLQAPGLQSESATLLRFDMQKNDTSRARQPLQRTKPYDTFDFSNQKRAQVS